METQGKSTGTFLEGHGMPSTALVIADVEIVQDAQGRYNLNTLHRASRAAKHKGPTRWLENTSTQELIAELNSQNPNSEPDVVTGGNHAGTYAHELLAISYAGWISPAFQLRVNQAFLDRRRPQEVPAFQLPSPAETLETLGACKAFLENLGCFDDRDSITFAAYARCVASTAMQPLLPARTPPDPSVIDTTQPVLWTTSMRLQYLRYPVLTGVDGDSKRIRIGSLAKKAYQAEYGEVPKKMWDYVRGQQRQVNAYQPERLHVLDQAIETILGAPRLQVVTPL